MDIAVSTRDASIKAIVQKTFPDYHGRKIKVCPQEYPLDVTSYWSGGTRSYFVAIELRNLRTMGVPQNGTPFDGGPIAPNGVLIPIGFAIIEHRWFCGHDLGVRIHVHPDMLPKMLN